MTRMKKSVLSAAIVTALASIAGAAQARPATAQEVSFTNPLGRTIPAMLFQPANPGPYPAVIMLPGCAEAAGAPTRGESYRAWGERLAAAGYAALLVDSDTPRGTQAPCERGGAAAADRAADADGALRFLAARGIARKDRIGLIGWSQGASGALAAVDASRSAGGASPFKAAVAFYPDCALDDAFGGVAHSTWKPYAPVKILHGTADARYRAGSCLTRIARAQRLGAPSVSLVAHHGVRSGFDAAIAGSAAYTTAELGAKQVADADAMNLLNGLLKH